MQGEAICWAEVINIQMQRRQECSPAISALHLETSSRTCLCSWGFGSTFYSLTVKKHIKEFSL